MNLLVGLILECSTWWSFVPFRKMCPSRRHLRVRLSAHGEMMRFLIIFNSLCFEKSSSILGVIPEFAHRCRFKVRVISTQLVVGINLVKSILVPKEFILSKVHIIFLSIEFISLFSCKVLTITSRMVPMMIFENILGLLIDNESIAVGVIVMDKLF